MREGRRVGEERVEKKRSEKVEERGKKREEKGGKNQDIRITLQSNKQKHNDRCY